MNEQIRQLALQAGYTTDMFGIGHWDMPECQKFAELIVKECVAIANRQFSAATGLDDRDCLTAQQMKQHFGVEE
jgi:CTP:phosphocholine cytidylyltransferase-like protein